MNFIDWIGSPKIKEQSLITNPDLVIETNSLDPAARDWENLEYPFKNIPVEKRKGCYLFFDSFGDNEKKEIIPIYAGKSENLSKRLYSHWSSNTNNLERFNEESNDFEGMSSDLYEFTGCQFPDGKSKVAIWLIKDNRARMLYEHKIIGILQPLYNRG